MHVKHQQLLVCPLGVDAEVLKMTTQQSASLRHLVTIGNHKENILLSEEVTLFENKKRGYKISPVKLIGQFDP